MVNSSRSIQPIEQIARAFAIAAGLTIGYFLLQISGTSRQITCKPKTNQAVVCHYLTQDFLWLRTIEQPRFQLQSAQLVPYQASHSSAEGPTTYYEAYRLDLEGLQTDGNQLSVPLYFYDDDRAQAQADLNQILALKSGTTNQPIVRGDRNGFGIILLPIYSAVIASRLKSAARVFLSRQSLTSSE
jgi:hypothetical protein